MLKTNDYIVASEFTRVIGSPFEIVHNQDRTIALAETMINTALGASEVVEYDFFVAVSGVYTISGLLIAPDGTSDSFHMSLDGEAIQIWHTGTSSTFRKRTWKTATLSEGKHTLRVMGRETGCKCSVWIIEDTNGNLVTPSKFSVEPNGIVRANISEVGITNGLVAYYPLNKDAKDYSGNGYHGTVNGAVLTGGGFDGTGAYRFDGVDDDIAISGLTGTGDVPLSVSLWFKSNTTTIQDWTGLFGVGPDGAANRCFTVNKESNNTWRLHTHSHSISSGIPLDLNWHHVVAINTGNGSQEFYADGIFMGSKAHVLNINLSQIRLGRRFNSTRFFNGDISNVKIFNRALTPEEIAVEYKRTGPTKMTQHNGTVYLQGQIKETI